MTGVKLKRSKKIHDSQMHEKILYFLRRGELFEQFSGALNFFLILKLCMIFSVGNS